MFKPKIQQREGSPDIEELSDRREGATVQCKENNLSVWKLVNLGLKHYK